MLCFASTGRQDTQIVFEWRCFAEGKFVAADDDSVLTGVTVFRGLVIGRGSVGWG